MTSLELDDRSAQVRVVTEAGRPSQNLFGRLLQRRRDVALLHAEQEYASVLQEACGEDFSDLDQLDFLKVSGRDHDGRCLVIVTSRNYPAKVLDAERVYRYLIARLDSISEEPYSVIWFHTRSSYWRNCPSVSWIWRTYERLPAKYRANLHRLFVVHCDLPLWLGLSAVGPLCSGELWRKVEWVSRVEFLWDHAPKKQLAVPGFVLEHDAILEDQPLMDYGLVASKEVGSVPGLPAPI